MLQFIYESRIRNKIGAHEREKEKLFSCNVYFVPRNFCSICILCQYAEYWISFQNIYICTSKNITSFALLLFKIFKSLHCIETFVHMVCFPWFNSSTLRQTSNLPYFYHCLWSSPHSQHQSLPILSFVPSMSITHNAVPLPSPPCCVVFCRYIFMPFSPTGRYFDPMRISHSRFCKKEPVSGHGIIQPILMSGRRRKNLDRIIEFWNSNFIWFWTCIQSKLIS